MCHQYTNTAGCTLVDDANGDYYHTSTEAKSPAITAKASFSAMTISADATFKLDDMFDNTSETCLPKSCKIMYHDGASFVQYPGTSGMTGVTLTGNVELTFSPGDYSFKSYGAHKYRVDCTNSLKSPEIPVTVLDPNAGLAGQYTKAEGKVGKTASSD